MARVESYFTGINTNVPGRTERMPVVFMAGLPAYRQLCEEVETQGYHGFTLATHNDLSGVELSFVGDEHNAAFA
jgi:hypothetical protein